MPDSSAWQITEENLSTCQSGLDGETPPPRPVGNFFCFPIFSADVISTKENLALQQILYILLIWDTNGLKETRQKDKISPRTTGSNPNSTCRKNQWQTEKHLSL